jgi:transposase
MSSKELRRVEVMGRVKAGSLKLNEAGELLEISYRQTKRLWKRYREGGREALQHRSCGRTSNRAKPVGLRRRVLKRVQQRYADFGATLASEHLREEDGLEVHAETLRRWLKEAGMSRRQRKRKPYRKRRERKQHFGELVQMDGSFHLWLEERGGQGCLMDMVDDATGRAEGEFSPQETTWAAAKLLQRWIEQYGVPCALYTDWKNVYVQPPSAQEKIRGEQPQTQFGRMCAELGIGIIPANSPQAKGRVERGHGTHQDRLVKKLRLRGINSYEEANRYLRQSYWEEHNRRYERKAAGGDYHLRRPSVRQLEAVFCLKQERVVSQDWVVSYNGRWLQLERQSRHWAPASSRVTVCEWEDGRIGITYRGQRLPFHEIFRRREKPAAAAEPPAMRKQHPQPAAQHPWRFSYKAPPLSSTLGRKLEEKACKPNSSRG